MVMGMSATVFASDVTGDKGSTSVEYTRSAGWTVTIPAKATYNPEAETPITITAKDVSVGDGQHLAVTITGITESKLTLTNGGATFDVPIKVGDADWAVGTEVGTFASEAAPANTAGALKLMPNGAPTVAGTYTGTMDFGIAAAN